MVLAVIPVLLLPLLNIVIIVVMLFLLIEVSPPTLLCYELCSTCRGGQVDQEASRNSLKMNAT